MVLKLLKQTPFASEQRITNWLTNHPNDFEIRFRLVEKLVKQRQFQQALTLLNSLDQRIQNRWHERCFEQKVIIHEQSGQLTEAAGCLEILLQHRSTNVFALQKQAAIFAGCGQHADALQALHRLAQIDAARRIDLIMLAFNGRWLYGDSELRSLQQKQPADSLVRAAVQNADLQRRRTVNIPDATPASIDDQCRLLATDPWNRRLNFALANQIRSTHQAAAQKLVALASQLETIESLARQHLRPPQATSTVTEQLCQQLLNLGRIDEVRNWIRLSTASSNPPDWVFHFKQKISQNNDFMHPVTLVSDRQSTRSEKSLSGSSSSTNSSSPNFMSDNRVPRGHANTTVQAAAVENSSVEERDSIPQAIFQEEANRIGLRFQYQNGLKTPIAGVFMHQWTGGGLAVTDINNDAWPDLYVSQSGILGSPQPDVADRIFVNQRGQKFDDSTSAARVTETEFGQGVAAGDVNQDGFQDLVVAQIGVNRLLLNLGDGTYEATDLPGPACWTTSIAIADLTGDTVPDIYCVNYVGGERVFQQLCDHQGHQRTCGPSDFPAEPDILLIGQNQHRWKAVVVGGDVAASHNLATDDDIQSAANSAVSDRVPELDDDRGMGIVIGPFGADSDAADSNAADFVAHVRNAAYVANDEGSNALWHFDHFGSSTDTAWQAGIAVDGSGDRQGSMGIAASDLNGDAIPDLFVTNYYAEPNNLFSSVAAGLYQDTTNSAQLFRNTVPLLGFGTAAIDANADGLEDLICVNGHLDDFRHRGHPFRMPTRLFLNNRQTFAPTDAGEFFKHEILGRSLAVWDWNWDGRLDVVIYPIDSPLCLLTNRSSGQLNQLAFVGTKSARMPIGTQATTKTSSRWLFAGGGYQASHQNAVFLPNSSKVNIQWPKHQTPHAVMLSSGRKHTVIEGRRTAFWIPQ